MKTILIAGLGNPGKEYEKTRHNAGFLFVDLFFEKYRDEFGLGDWKFSKKLKADVSVGKRSGAKIILQEQGCTLLRIFKTKGAGCKPAPATRIILLKPQTFMNLSGKAVLAAMKYYKILFEVSPRGTRGETSNQLLVVQDEMDLPLGNYKFSTDSSSAGHKGAESVIDALGTKNFTRLRIGIDNRGEKNIPTEKYVLGKFTEREISTLKKIFLKSMVELVEKFQI
jgi:PTH1 family peptidyl-tRNA hydrolase